MESIIIAIVGNITIPAGLLFAGGLGCLVLGMAIERMRGPRVAAGGGEEIGREIRRMRRDNVLLTEERDRYRDAMNQSRRRKSEARKVSA